MKRIVLFITTSFSFLVVKAATITWIGLSGSNWNNTLNWSPAMVPNSGDDVVFNTSVVVDMDIITTPTIYTINSLLITNNSSVELLKSQIGGGVRVLQVKSTSTVTKGLQIDNGSVLLIHGVNDSGTLEFILDFGSNSGVTGEISGELQFSGVGSTGTQNDTKLRLYTDISNNASLVVKSGGIIRYLPETGNTISSSGGTYLIMENGSKFILEKNAGSFPTGGAWDPNSFVIVENLFGNNAPFFNGEDYGNLEWNSPNLSFTSGLNKDISFNNVHFISTNNADFRIRTGASTIICTLTVKGNLTVSSDSRIEITRNNVPTGYGGRLELKGNLIDSGIIASNGIAGTINDFELNGSSNQAISNIGSGTFAGSIKFIMNNSSGATLLTPLILPDSLALINGKIKTNSFNLLTMSASSLYTGGSTSSFIDGPMKKIGNDDFVFPIGTGGIYAPIGISLGIGELVSDEFTAEYLRTNPQGVHGNTYDAGINHISFVEYWKLNQNMGTSTKIVTLDIHPTSFAKVVANTFVSQFNGLQWTNEPSTPVSSGVCNILYECGTTSTISAMANFGDFTLATDLSVILNPLPIKLINFSATKITNYIARIEWELAVCCSKDATFVLEKSTDGSNFNSFSSAKGSETNRFYNVTDALLTKGTTYYRLKMMDTDGSVKYSKIVAIVNDEKGFIITSIAPNPVQNDIATITLSAAKKGIVHFYIYDMAGNVVKQWQSNIAAGNNNINMYVSELAGGAYHVVAATNDSKATFRFVKQ